MRDGQMALVGPRDEVLAKLRNPNAQQRIVTKPMPAAPSAVAAAPQAAGGAA
jgi:hypothetical protein